MLSRDKQQQGTDSKTTSSSTTDAMTAVSAAAAGASVALRPLSSMADSRGHSRPRRRLLDIGAGDGFVTSQMARSFDEVVATESSWRMARRLRQRGFRCVESSNLSEAFADDVGFDVVCCLNVVDRCSMPLSLLRDIHGLLRDNQSRVVLAVPFPFSQAVEKGNRLISPSQKIDIPRYSSTHGWEDGVCYFVDAVLLPAGYHVEALTRVPYLCQGDSNNPYYVLDDAVFVLSSILPKRDRDANSDSVSIAVS